jgi:hypothetical protein
LNKLSEKKAVIESASITFSPEPTQKGHKEYEIPYTTDFERIDIPFTVL